jgi:hypothetical protein
MWLMPERYCMRQAMRSGYCLSDGLHHIWFDSVSVRKSVFFRRQNYFINWFTLISNDYKSPLINSLELLALRSKESNDTNNVCRNQLRQAILCYRAFSFSRNKVIMEKKREDYLATSSWNIDYHVKRKKNPLLEHTYADLINYTSSM